MTIQVFTPRLQYYVGKIENGECYSMVRLGDGEFSAILQDRQRTSSRSQMLNILALKKGMRRLLIECPKDSNFIISMRPGSQRPGIEAWIEKNARPNIKWHDCRILYQSSKRGELYSWVKAIREHSLPTVIVGPERHKTLHGRMFNIAQHIVIPNRNCFVEANRIMQEVFLPGRPAIILFSAGPAAKVMIHQLWLRGLGEQSYLLDVGSLLDPYTGPPMKISRKYHKHLRDNPAIIKKNLTGE